MDLELLAARLVQAEERVVEGAKYIAEQSAFVATLERNVGDTTTARHLLAHFEAMQAMHVAERDRLKRELAANDN